jgi:tetratricopeptide (TPR) repeat protein
MMWPYQLAIFYPYPKAVSIWKVIIASVFLSCLTVVLIRVAKRFPYLTVGWLWYLGTLVPVIGLVQVGSQAMADRFTYVPLIGLFIMIAWGVPELLKGWRYRRIAYVISTSVVLSAFMTCTWLQGRHWQNSITLFTHTLKVTADNWLAHNNLGVALYGQGRPEEAIKHYSEALRIRPDYADAHYNLGIALAKQARLEDAIMHYSEALRIKPDHASAHNSLGHALFRKGEFEEAIGHYSEALRINPDHAGAHHNMGIVFAEQGKLEEAIIHYSETLRAKPDHAKAHNNLGVLLARQGRLEEAARHFSAALRINPDHAGARHNLELTLRLMGDARR